MEGAERDNDSFGIRLRKKLPEKAELLQHKFDKASRFVVSSQIWLNTIPTRNCDVLMTFSKKTTDDSVQWLLEQLKKRAPEVKIYVRYHTHTGQYGFYLSADYEALLKAAEELSLHKTVKDKYGGGKKEYVNSDRHLFKGIDKSSTFFTSQERQMCLQHLLYNLRANEGETLDNITFLEGQSIVPILQSKNVIADVLPLHTSEDITYLREHWMWAFNKSQPLDRICDYFGVKIAMYFAYLGHYTIYLILPMLIGIALWFICGASQVTDDYCFVIFALINVVWSTLYLQAWKRKSAELAYAWGTLDCEDELLTEPRPLYHGYLVQSEVTGRLEMYYPAWKRALFKYLVCWPIMGFCLFVVFVDMWCIFEFQDWINERILHDKYSSVWKYIPKIMLAASIAIMDEIYKKIAIWLNDKENYRQEETYQNYLIVKLILFQFVNSFLSLFYIAFYLQDMDRLRDQLAMLLITRQVLGNLKESVLPYAIDKLKLFWYGYKLTEDMSPGSLQKQAKHILDTQLKRIPKDNDESKSVAANEKSNEETTERTDSSEDQCPIDGAGNMSSLLPGVTSDHVPCSGPQLTQAEVEAAMVKYEDTFEDQLEMFIQFGYVTLFSSAFPLAALCAFVNNIMEIRIDAFKLCMACQRPFGQRVNSIGTWQYALEVMSIIAVMVNCALIGISDLAGRMFPEYSTAERLVMIIALEHVILAAKLLITHSIPDKPHWVAKEKAKLEFLRRQALKNMKTHRASHIPADMSCSGSEENSAPEDPVETSGRAGVTSIHTGCGDADTNVIKNTVSRYHKATESTSENRIDKEYMFDKDSACHGNRQASLVKFERSSSAPPQGANICHRKSYFADSSTSYSRFRSSPPRSTWSSSWSTIHHDECCTVRNLSHDRKPCDILATHSTRVTHL